MFGKKKKIPIRNMFWFNFSFSVFAYDINWFYDQIDLDFEQFKFWSTNEPHRKKNKKKKHNKNTYKSIISILCITV